MALAALSRWWIGSRNTASERERRPSTALLVEPDASLTRTILTFLSRRDHRVIPVESYDAALEAVQRFRFDIVLCAGRIGAGTWVDFLPRVRGKVGVFVLVTDVEQVDLGDAFVLRKPIDESEFDSLLQRVETRHALYSST